MEKYGRTGLGDNAPDEVPSQPAPADKPVGVPAEPAPKESEDK